MQFFFPVFCCSRYDFKSLFLCVVLKSLNLFTILRNLMAKQDMSELGFRIVDEAGTSPDKNSKPESPPNQPKD
jgi:hypothetical protein